MAVMILGMIMVVYIDDAGTGDLLGPAIIMFWQKETNLFMHKIVPLEIYQSPNFNQESRLFIKKIFQDSFEELNIQKTEQIFICRGGCFELAKKWMRENNYNYKTTKIEGVLQERVEEFYNQYLHIEYGIPKKRLNVQSGKKRYFEQFHWMTKNYPVRHQYVKSGFPAWKAKWKHKALEEWKHRKKIGDNIQR